MSERVSNSLEWSTLNVGLLTLINKPGFLRPSWLVFFVDPIVFKDLIVLVGQND